MIDFSVYGKKTPEVFAVKCPNCGKVDYPAPMLCKKCGERRDPSGSIFKDWEKVSLGGPCKLLAWTRVYALPEGFDVKYLLFGIVEFENGLRASGRLLVDQPETNMKLNARADVIRDVKGVEIYGFMFEK
ncbi:MAG: zinc ribbon domain-containing protein [Spirochaetes bacterium]|nr:zinc ribbon domain-containing protein [Spirochaetota bacterium]